MIKSHFHQVVHDRGHGFSKRFNPAGVHYCTHTRSINPEEANVLKKG